MQFEVSDVKSNDRIGVVEADNYLVAALLAAAKFFSKQTARRETGWGGRPGEFAAFDLDEDTTVNFMLRQL